MTNLTAIRGCAAVLFSSCHLARSETTPLVYCSWCNAVSFVAHHCVYEMNDNARLWYDLLMYCCTKFAKDVKMWRFSDVILWIHCPWSFISAGFINSLNCLNKLIVLTEARSIGVMCHMMFRRHQSSVSPSVARKLTDGGAETDGLAPRTGTEILLGHVTVLKRRHQCKFQS
jgi:hypothetical protein